MGKIVVFNYPFNSNNEVHRERGADDRSAVLREVWEINSAMCPMSAADCQRRSGSLARQSRTRWSSACGASGCARDGRRLVLENRPDDAGRRLALERPRPYHLVDHAPSAQMSLRASASLPSTCSGAMYCTVPRIVPCAVRARASRAVSSPTSRWGPLSTVTSRARSRAASRRSWST